MLKEQAVTDLPVPSYLVYDTVHAKKRVQDYRTKLHKKPGTGKTMCGPHVNEGMIVGETTFSLNAVWRPVFDKMARTTETKSMKDNPTGKLPQVMFKAGDETVDFCNLQEALAFLVEHPNKLVWVWSLDIPSYPMGQQTDENTATLILGHPSANWGYTPLTSIYASQHHEDGIDTRAPNLDGAWGPMMQALQVQAPDNHPVERLYHDVHKHSTNINTLMRSAHAAVHQQWPDLDQVGNFYSVSQVMEGPVRAVSFAVSTASAMAYVNQSGKSAAVISVVDAKDSWTVLIGPPPG